MVLVDPTTMAPDKVPEEEDIVFKHHGRLHTWMAVYTAKWIEFVQFIDLTTAHIAATRVEGHVSRIVLDIE